MPKFFYSPDGDNGGTGETPNIEQIVAEKLAEEKSKWEAENEQRFKARINETEKGIRERLQKEAQKAAMTAEEKAKVEYEERFNSVQAERDQYRAKYRDMSLRAKLTEAGLPVELYIDNKRLDVGDEQLDDVIKSLKKTHESFITSGRTSPSTTPKTNMSPNKLTNEDLEKLAISDPEEYRRLRREKLYGVK